MVDLALECDSCGHLMRVSEFAIGATGTCRNCGAELRVSLANTRPIGDEKLEPLGSRSSAPEAPTEVVGQVDGDHCARCGRAFRGDWDKYESAKGVVCHICANLAEGPGEVQEEVGEVTPVRAVYGRDALDMPEPKQPPNPEFVEKRRREEMFQRGVLVAALAMIVLAIFATMFTDLDTQPVVDETGAVSQAGGEAAEAPPELPGWLPFAVRGIQFFVGFLGNVLILFLMLTWVNKLPNDTFTANLISLSVVGFGLSILSVLIGVLAQIPFVGIVWGILGPFIILYIIYSLYNLTVAELLLYFVAYILVLGLMTISRILLLALLGAIVL